MQQTLKMRIGFAIILAVGLFAGYIAGCGGSSSDSGSSGATEAKGIIDTAFGTLGVVTNTMGVNDARIVSLALQSDGKIVVAGNSLTGSDRAFILARYTTAGVLDSAFGMGGGVITTTVNVDSSARAMALQSNGNILLAGGHYDGLRKFGVYRYTADGALDSAFGANGVVSTTIGSDSAANALALQPDGKILLAGYADDSGDDFALARYNPNGTPDTGFGTAGITTTAICSGYDAICALAVQPDGKILAGGYATDGLDEYLVLARYTVTGTLDSAFGSSGVVTKTLSTASPKVDRINDIAIQPDGKIIVAGYSSAGASDGYGLLVRYNADGTLDTGFSNDGVITATITNYTDVKFYGVELQSNGKIVAAGSGWFGSVDFLLARYNADGTPDTGFGTAGAATTTISSLSYAMDCKIQSDGKIVAGGYTYTGSTYQFGLARYK